MVQVRDVLDAVRDAYPERLAENWDTGIGLTCGDPDAEVASVLLAVDADTATVAEAIQRDDQVLLTHHPLLFRPIQSIAADTVKGGLLHALVRAGVAHIAAHTNADRAAGGVNDALADALGLLDTEPVRADPAPLADKLVVFTPEPHADAVLAAMSRAGAGRIGDYNDCAFLAPGTGQFRPEAGATPFTGTVGELQRVPELRLEMIAPRSERAAILAAARQAHPYSEPAIDVVELAASPATTGLGRVGSLATPVTLAAFVAHVADRLPATVTGVRAAGDPLRSIHRVAVCGGAGDSELPAAARVGADAVVTSDLRHHVVAEFVAVPRHPAVVEVAHWAGEWPWLERAAGMIHTAFGGRVTAAVSSLRTDPWTVHAASPTPSVR